MGSAKLLGARSCMEDWYVCCFIMGGEKKREGKIRFGQDKRQSQAILAHSCGREPKEGARSAACFCLPRGNGERGALRNLLPGTLLPRGPWGRTPAAPQPRQGLLEGSVSSTHLWTTKKSQE